MSKLRTCITKTLALHIACCLDNDNDTDSSSSSSSSSKNKNKDQMEATCVTECQLQSSPMHVSWQQQQRQALLATIGRGIQMMTTTMMSLLWLDYGQNQIIRGRGRGRVKQGQMNNEVKSKGFGQKNFSCLVSFYETNLRSSVGIEISEIWRLRIANTITYIQRTHIAHTPGGFLFTIFTSLTWTFSYSWHLIYVQVELFQ